MKSPLTILPSHLAMAQNHQPKNGWCSYYGHDHFQIRHWYHNFEPNPLIPLGLQLRMQLGDLIHQQLLIHDLVATTRGVAWLLRKPVVDSQKKGPAHIGRMGIVYLYINIMCKYIL